VIPRGWLQPAWVAPTRVGAAMTTRDGGSSRPPFDAMNLGAYVGDDASALQANMAAFADALEAKPVFLKQVHGARVADLDVLDVLDDMRTPEADASVTTRPGVACVVTVADCLPVLFAAGNARAVGAAHAGWRGLAGGVVEACLQAVSEKAGCTPGDVHAWLGACIGPTAFEVGAEVLEAFGRDPRADVTEGFVRSAPAADGSPRWMADLPGLTRERLAAAGVTRVSGGQWCTVSDASRFFSFRRDRLTGRMAAAVWLR